LAGIGVIESDAAFEKARAGIQHTLGIGIAAVRLD
jgi:hypothetical protein